MGLGDLETWHDLTVATGSRRCPISAHSKVEKCKTGEGIFFWRVGLMMFDWFWLIIRPKAKVSETKMSNLPVDQTPHAQEKHNEFQDFPFNSHPLKWVSTPNTDPNHHTLRHYNSCQDGYRWFGPFFHGLALTILRVPSGDDEGTQPDWKHIENISEKPPASTNTHQLKKKKTWLS